MRIKTKSGEIDTDKLPDMDALVMEKLEELKNICVSSGHRCMFFIEQKSTADAYTAFVANSEGEAKEMLRCLFESVINTYKK